MLVVLVGVEVVVKLEVLGTPMLKVLVVASDQALAMLTGIGTDQVMQVQMLMAMVVAQGTATTVGLAAVKVLDLGMAMPTPEFCIKSI
jgi:hypothetical protein